MVCVLCSVFCGLSWLQALLDSLEKFLQDGGAIQQCGVLGVLEFGMPLDGKSVGCGVGAAVSLGDEAYGLDHLVFGAAGFDAEIAA